MIPRAPPPPARRSRRPFVTVFLGDVFPFLAAKDLLVCMQVCHVWREEANALFLWRTLLIDNPNTAMYAYRGLTVGAIRKIVLRGPIASSTNRNHVGGMHSCEVSVANKSPDITLELEPKMPLSRPIKNGTTVQAFSSGASFALRAHKVMSILALEGEETYSLVKGSAGSLLLTMEILQAHTGLLKKQIVSNARVIQSLGQQFPSNGAVWLHQECIREWKKLKMFEEMVVISLYGELGPSCRVGIRSFVQAEIAIYSETDPSVSLQWCRFKNALPLDDHYYNYVDLLHSWGPSRVGSLKMFSHEEDMAKREMERFSALRDLIEDVVGERYSQTGKKSWEPLLLRLENKSYLNEEKYC